MNIHTQDVSDAFQLFSSGWAAFGEWRWLPIFYVRADLMPTWIFLRLDLFFELWTLDNGGNKTEKGLQIIIALHFSVLWSLGVSIIQIWNNNFLKSSYHMRTMLGCKQCSNLQMVCNLTRLQELKNGSSWSRGVTHTSMAHTPEQGGFTRRTTCPPIMCSIFHGSHKNSIPNPCQISRTEQPSTPF